VHIRYPLTELACAAVAVLAALHDGLTLEALSITGLGWCVVAIIVTDLEHYIILDEVQIALALFGVLHAYATRQPWEHVALAAGAGAAIGLALKYGFIYLRHKDGLGMGDVKFLCVAGIWLAIGVISGSAWRMAGLGEHFPFGPALAIALVLCVIYPPLADQFWQLYGLLLSGSSG
jgi:prepilin signal peptidase PulO-like enzyme (type II secretory pathway)